MPVRMRLLATAVALLCVNTASAQSSVTLYGRIDASINSLWFSSPRAATARTLSSDTSFWGLRGSEDMGNGLSALFKLESQFQIDSGNQGSATTYFNRESYVGFRSARAGTLLLGAQFTPTVWLTAKVDPFARSNLANIVNLFQGGQRGYQPIFNNAVQYISPNVGGFTARAIYALGEGANTGNSKAASVEYASGPLILGVSHDDVRLAPASVGLPAAQPPAPSSTTSAGGSYDFGAARVVAYYQTNRVARLSRVDGWMVGAVVPVPTGHIRVGYSRSNITASTEGRQIGIGYFHPLSRRTTVYVNAARIYNEGSTAVLWPARQDIVGQGLPMAGQDVRGLQIGLRHLF